MLLNSGCHIIAKFRTLYRLQTNLPRSDMSSAPPPPPLQVVPAPPPNRPKRKRLARAYSTGRTVPAPRASAPGPGNFGTGPSTHLPVELAQNMSPQDSHPSADARSLRPQQSSYTHSVPPYHAPPPPPPVLPTSLPHRQQSQSSSSSHQHPLSLYNPTSSSVLYPAPALVAPRPEWDVHEAPLSLSAPRPESLLSRKRPRQDRPDFESRETFDTNWARDQDSQQTAADHRSTTFDPALADGYTARPSIELGPALTRELTNLFFTHSHPMVMIIHKPSFTNAVTMNQVPMYLLYAVCALASRHSKQPSLAADPRRLSGRHFADEAVKMMFAPPKKHSVPGWSGEKTPLDPVTEGYHHLSTSASKDPHQAQETSNTNDLYSGELVLPASLYTAQTLCLLAVYELLAWEPGTVHQQSKFLSPQGERFRELTLRMVKELGVHQPSFPLLTPVPSHAFIEESIERECVRLSWLSVNRRVFWLIYILDCLREIYYQGEGPLLGGSGRGYHSEREYAGRFPPHTANVSQETTMNPVSHPDLSKLSSNTILSIPFAFNPQLPQDRSLPASFTPSMRAFSNGFIGFSSEELCVRLPVDETSFEMGVVHQCLPEYLYLPSNPAPSADLPSHKTSSKGSELAQTIRILSIYNKIERTLDGLYHPSPPPLHIRNIDPLFFSTVPIRHSQGRASLNTALTEDQQLFAAWDACHPADLRWDEDGNVIVQKSMLETNSNTGAWCFCLIAMLEASCIMGLGIGRRAVQGERWPHWENVTSGPDIGSTGSAAAVSNEVSRSGMTDDHFEHDWWKVTHRKDRPSETDLEWGIRRLDDVLETLGDRAASSTALAVWIWPLRKYLHRDDEKIHIELDKFEEFCGIRMDKLSGNNWGIFTTGRTGETTDAEMADATSSELVTQIAANQSGYSFSSDGSGSPVVAVSASGSGKQMPMLQALPSLKSSGLLDWSNRSSIASHLGPGVMQNHHSLPQLNVGAANLTAYAGGSPRTPGGGTLATPTSASSAVMSLPGSSSSKDSGNAYNSTQPGNSNTQHGRSGLSWMMNE
ncbi:hypothetical protein F5880DRAFT_1509609 [Lentinula raphanica]|nr:hypothetical protein F5880DRAFT_1509609 [Lentinula raphanica]